MTSRPIIQAFAKALPIVPWLILLVFALVALFFWRQPAVSPEESVAPSAEEIGVTPNQSSDPSSDAASELSPASSPETQGPPIQLPDQFPKSHSGFVLESVKKEDSVDGVLHYFVASYLADDSSEVSVRLLSLDPATSDQFTKNLIKALLSSNSVKNAGVPRLAIPRGWDSSHLFNREDAGIYIAVNPKALVMVSAPTPEIAMTFGSGLHLTPQ